MESWDGAGLGRTSDGRGLDRGLDVHIYPTRPIGVIDD